jgi:transketolase
MDDMGVRATVVALPWLSGVDGGWLAQIAGDAPVVCLDNHVLAGGQGAAVQAAIAGVRPATRVHRIGVEGIPACGRNDEILREHGLDAPTLARIISAGVQDLALPAR